MERDDNLLRSDIGRPPMVHDGKTKENNPFTSGGQSLEPRNLKQVQNIINKIH